MSHNRLNGAALNLAGGNANLKIVRLALNASELATIKHTLRQTIEATKMVMKETAWPAKVRAMRQSELEALEKALTTIVEQEKIG